MAGALPVAVGAATGCPAYRGRPRQKTAKEQHVTPQRTELGTVVGSLRAVDGKAIVRMDATFGTDAEDLWSALTDPQRLARWGRAGRRRPAAGGRVPGQVHQRLGRCRPGRRVRAPSTAPGHSVSRAGRPDRHRGRARSRWRPDPSGPGGARAAPERGGRTRRRMAGTPRGSRRAPGRPPDRGLADPMDRTDADVSRPAGPSRMTRDHRDGCPAATGRTTA